MDVQEVRLRYKKAGIKGRISLLAEAKKEQPIIGYAPFSLAIIAFAILVFLAYCLIEIFGDVGGYMAMAAALLFYFVANHMFWVKIVYPAIGVAMSRKGKVNR